MDYWTLGSREMVPGGGNLKDHPKNEIIFQTRNSTLYMRY
jgi:hypothetical protein